MTINWTITEGCEQPLEIDDTSSPTAIFLRKNIQEIEKENQDGTTIPMWQYEEAILSKKEYPNFTGTMELINMLQEEKNTAMQEQIDTMSANIDYIAMMQDIGLE